MTSQHETNEAPFRHRFVVNDPRIAYLDGNSLGRLPQATKDRIQQVVSQEWGEDLIGSWNRSWLPIAKRIGDKIASLIGASPGEVMVCDSTSINLYKAAWALLQRRGNRKTIVTDAANFPTDLYILDGLRQQLGSDLRLEPLVLDQSDHSQVNRALADAINDDTALVCLSHVNYKTGYAFDLPGVTELAHGKEAPILWDLSHSVGAIPLDLGNAQVDAAVGCTYKYLNGGPGAPAFIMIRGDLIRELSNPIPGWFGAANPFQFGAIYEPASGIERFAIGTPPILSLAAIEPGVDLTCEAGMMMLRQRGWGLMQQFFQLYDERLQSLGFRLETPRHQDSAGSHVSLSHKDAWQITQDLIHTYRVVPDFRGPDIIRFGITPLYTLASEVEQAAFAMEASVTQGTFRSHPKQARGVT
ncbi:MAG: aminotransferase class V-fold PLP-dependent enzyme [Pirellula sp.]|nr:aminotransferase class V-fold PLP-dependent enzyme [Pirellula sp.]